MRELAAVKFIEKKSRFYAHLYDVDSTDEIDEIVKNHKRLYKKANHHCYALRFISPESKKNEFFKDDSEVGHPGKVLVELLIKNNMNHHMLIVSRVFGGIKLGVGGVSRAFKSAGESVINYHKSKEKG
ncbi:MAG: YigZ family protein [Candidatus Thermoplasmatota archaeon]|nr:YigZ family protein [Candidatus Thermoplasmatota archaeon]